MLTTNLLSLWIVVFFFFFYIECHEFLCERYIGQWNIILYVYYCFKGTKQLFFQTTIRKEWKLEIPKVSSEHYLNGFTSRSRRDKNSLDVKCTLLVFRIPSVGSDVTKAKGPFSSSFYPWIWQNQRSFNLNQCLEEQEVGVCWFGCLWQLNTGKIWWKLGIVS